MRKTLLFGLLLSVYAVGLVSTSAKAAPGDTTRVTIWNQRKMTRYGNYDTTAVLPAPGTRYRKVLMHYILGRYACAPGSQYCGSWDYTTKVSLLPPAHDTVEMARIITPYASQWLGLNLSHDYVVDVSEYAPLLHDTRTFRYLYDGYSWGFTVTIRLEFIEGIPPQDPIDVRNVYAGTFRFGDAADPINAHLPDRNLTAPAANTIRLKNVISGHGADANNCAEFCRQYYRFAINGTVQGFRYLWRPDCGRNDVLPQNGTWVYNRSNWCPGNYVAPLWHALSPLVLPGQPYTLRLYMPNYTASVPPNASRAVFIWSSQLVTSGPVNFTTDASIDAIIAPTIDRAYLHDNPICGNPQVRLRNLGSNRLTTATVHYLVEGRGTPQTYSWTGDLAFGGDTLVVLPALSGLLTGTTGGRFRTWVTSPNGLTDQNHANDTLAVRFASSFQLPTRPVISFTTNNARANGYCETSWEVLDVTGTVVAQRTQAATSTTYNDTLSLPGGCYTLRVTDTGGDGLAWNYSPASVGRGTLAIRHSRTGAVLRSISGDFGSEYLLSFRLPNVVTATASAANAPRLTVYPNPSADGRFTLGLATPQPLRVRVLDALGRPVYAKTLAPSPAPVSLDLHHLPAGIYTLEAAQTDGQRLVRQLAIQK